MGNGLGRQRPRNAHWILRTVRRRLRTYYSGGGIRMSITHTELGWLIFSVAVTFSLLAGIPLQPPTEIVEPQPQPQPEEIGSTDVESIDKPSEEPRSVAVGDAGACTDGSCGTQRRGFRGLFRRR